MTAVDRLISESRRQFRAWNEADSAAWKREIRRKHGMTDDPSEVRPGDVREFRARVTGQFSDFDGSCEVTFFHGAQDIRVLMSPDQLAASTLIRRAKPEIKVGMRVRFTGGMEIRTVIAIHDGKAWIDPAPFERSAIYPLSDLTPVEDKADG